MISKRILINWILLGIVLLLVTVIILAVIKAKTQDGRWPYYAKKLLSQPEQLLYHRLVQALPDHLIFAQVQLSRLLGIKKGNNYYAWLNRINRLSVDFVVCNQDSSIVAVIELDDATHQRKDRQTVDARKDQALSSADVQVVRWQVKSLPDIATIQASVLPDIAIKIKSSAANKPVVK